MLNLVIAVVLDNFINAAKVGTGPGMGSRHGAGYGSGSGYDALGVYRAWVCLEVLARPLLHHYTPSASPPQSEGLLVTNQFTAVMQKVIALRVFVRMLRINIEKLKEADEAKRRAAAEAALAAGGSNGGGGGGGAGPGAGAGGAALAWAGGEGGGQGEAAAGGAVEKERRRTWVLGPRDSLEGRTLHVVAFALRL